MLLFLWENKREGVTGQSCHPTLQRPRAAVILATGEVSTFGNVQKKKWTSLFICELEPIVICVNLNKCSCDVLQAQSLSDGIPPCFTPFSSRLCRLYLQPKGSNLSICGPLYTDPIILPLRCTSWHPNSQTTRQDKPLFVSLCSTNFCKTKDMLETQNMLVFHNIQIKYCAWTVHWYGFDNLLHLQFRLLILTLNYVQSKF